MNKIRNVQISYETFLSIIDLLEFIDIEKYDVSIQLLYDKVTNDLNIKRKRLETRDSYKELIDSYDTNDNDHIFDKRIEYFKKRNNN